MKPSNYINIDNIIKCLMLHNDNFTSSFYGCETKLLILMEERS